jgi:dihydroneopterin aldolase
MSNDIRLAFAHPFERAVATSQTGMLDRISLRDHIVSVDIGAFQAERGVQQRLCFNVVVEVQPIVDQIEDDVDRILSYDRVTEAIAAELDAERLNLLETLAERIAERILAEPQAMRVFVRIEKLDRGPGALGVEIVREGGDKPRAPAQDMVPHPLVVFLDNDMIAAEDITGIIDHYAGFPRPVIFTVGLPRASFPKAPQAAAQRRIDLLALEQNAWVLAGRDARCVVVGTRTELDWAMKNGQICVWAPSKMILDATHPPQAEPAEGANLAMWFAEAMQADQLIVMSDDPLPKGDIRASRVALASVQ